MSSLHTVRRRVRYLCAAVILLAAGTAARAAVGVDDSSSASGVGTQVLQWTHTVGAGSNRLLVVGVSIRGNRTVTGITYAGQGLTFLGASSNNNNRVRAEIWYLVAPPTGTATVAVNLSANARFTSGAVSFTGALQTGPVGPFLSNAGQGSVDPTLTMTSAAGELVLDVVAVAGIDQGLTPGGGQTEMWNLESGGHISGAASTEPGASSVTMSWSKARRGRWAMGATSIRPAAGELTLTKTVSAATARPGDLLTYTLMHTNTGSVDVFPTFTTDPIPADTDYQLGSAVFLPGTSGLTATIEFSDDGGASYGYTPVSGGGGAPAGLDRAVSDVRYIFSGTLSTVAPDNTFSVQFGVRIR